METTVKNASQLADDTIKEFKKLRRRLKMEKAEAEKQSGESRAGIMALIAMTLLAVYLAQRIFSDARVVPPYLKIKFGNCLS